MRIKRENGLTMIEAMLVVALTGILLIAAMKLIMPNVTFFRRSQIRQQAGLSARKCMETIQQLLSQGRSSTIHISTDAGAPPNSHLQFYTINNSSYTIIWSNVPPNSVHLQQTLNGQTVVTDNVIATQVTGLSFTLDFRDPTVINVSLQVDAPFDNSGKPGSVYTLIQPNQSIHMGAT